MLWYVSTITESGGVLMNSAISFVASSSGIWYSASSTGHTFGRTHTI